MPQIQFLSRVVTPAGVMINATIDDARAAGASEADIAEAVTAERRESARAECRRRIYAVASAETQLNMTSFVTAIGLKPASSRTEEEKAAASAFVVALGWIESMRAAVATIAGDAALDMSAPASWPACPAEVLALANRF
jgi:hypothetical protein